MRNYETGSSMRAIARSKEIAIEMSRRLKLEPRLRFVRLHPNDVVIPLYFKLYESDSAVTPVLCSVCSIGFESAEHVLVAPHFDVSAFEYLNEVNPFLQVADAMRYHIDVVHTQRPEPSEVTLAVSRYFLRKATRRLQFKGEFYG